MYQQHHRATPRAATERNHVYTDESSTQGKRFMLIGGVWIPATAEGALRADIAQIRAQHSLGREMKWGKVSANKLVGYRRLVDAFFASRHARFKCIVVDTHVVNYRRYSEGDGELGFYKFYFQLLSRTIEDGCDYVVIADHRTNTTDLPSFKTLRDCCNGWCARRSRTTVPSPIRSISPRDSKSEDLIQVCDVLLGAVGARFNRDVISLTKLALVEHIEKRVGRPLHNRCWPSVQKFNVWAWMPSTLS